MFPILNGCASPNHDAMLLDEMATVKYEMSQAKFNITQLRLDVADLQLKVAGMEQTGQLDTILQKVGKKPLP